MQDDDGTDREKADNYIEDVALAFRGILLVWSSSLNLRLRLRYRLGEFNDNPQDVLQSSSTNTGRPWNSASILTGWLSPLNGAPDEQLSDQACVQTSADEEGDHAPQ